jgi:hypothetical protein
VFTLLDRIPWFAAAPAVLVLAVAVGYVGRELAGIYFVQTCANEVNLLTGEFEESNCGPGRAAAAPGPGSGQPGGAVLATGRFVDGDPGHQGTGTVEVQRLADGSLNLFLKDFSVTNGPDLFVVLSSDAGPSRSAASEGLNLGQLKANNGNQNYSIEGGADLSRYRSVVIYCRQFNVVFAYAALDGGASVAEPTPTTAPVMSPPLGASPTAGPAASASPQSGVLARGEFRDGDPGHRGSGEAELQRLPDGTLNLFLRNFSVTSGPDLVVILSNDPEGGRGSVGSGLSLGALKANNGNQNYTVPAGADLAQFRSVIIWCKSFPTVFAYATLEAPR